MKLYEIRFTINGRRSMRYCHFPRPPTLEDASKALAARLQLPHVDSIHSFTDLVEANDIADVRWRLVDSRPSIVAMMPLPGRRPGRLHE